MLALSPKGHLYISSVEKESNPKIENNIIKSFQSSQEKGLISLAAIKNIDSLPPSLLYWKDFICLYLRKLCYQVQNDSLKPISCDEDLEKLVLNIPPMLGAEYCCCDCLKNIWNNFDLWVNKEIKKIGNGIKGFLSFYLPHWHQVGRVCFHLAENKQNEIYPFAFLVTYASSIGKQNHIQYKPLSKALQEYAGEKNKTALIHLLKPIHQASKNCTWVKNLVENGDIYHPLAWSAKEAYELLKTAHLLEESKVVLRLPNWWKKKPRPRVEISIGNKKKNCLNVHAMLDFKIDIAIDQTNLTKEDIEKIYNSDDGLVFIKGQWIEVDKEKIQEALNHWKSVQKNAGEKGLSFIEAMRLLSGSNSNLSKTKDFDNQDNNWSSVKAGDWLNNILEKIKKPKPFKPHNLKNLLHAKLRPYQKIGVSWLQFLTELGLGACLADDMGLGKTIQVIALLLMQKKQKHPSILVLPASLLSNWKVELQKFAPSLKIIYIHSSQSSKQELEKIKKDPSSHLNNIDIVITSYGMLLRQKWLKDQTWNLIILDEAQAIKNPSTNQSKATKSLKGKAKIALTGTPVENRLGDLWSLFDFLIPNLLGSSSLFKSFIKSLEKREHCPFAPLRKLVQPYILRRLKTDKNVINDLPDKTEITAFCSLTKEQVKLYTKAICNLKSFLKKEETGIKRKGIILSFLMHFKQICNHPSQFLEDEDYSSSHSGKFIRLAEICEEIAMRQEKVLIFTQFQKITKPLKNFLNTIFKKPGLVLDGSTPIKQRKNLVDNFQKEQGPPFFILSLKAGGTGLNLTAANHVIHFDRWWNPAVENQATDRAFRIGQKKKVLVHKFVCRGTIEEKIDKMIADKTKLADDILKKATETLITELNNDELINLVSLDITKF